MEMKEFQRKATTELFRKIMDILSGNEFEPNIKVTSRHGNTYIRLRSKYTMIKITIKWTGEISYKFGDALHITSDKIIYYEFSRSRNCEKVIENFAEDFSRLYRDFFLGEPSAFLDEITLSYGMDVSNFDEFEYGIKLSLGVDEDTNLQDMV